MKGIIKKALIVGLAGMMGIASIGLMGCTDDTTSEPEPSIYKQGWEVTTSEPVYIVVNENGVDTLHNGKIIEMCTASNWSSYSNVSITPCLDFDCGETLQTTQFIAYPKGCPKEDKYDKVCDCAREAILNHDSEISSESEINYDVIDREL